MLKSQTSIVGQLGWQGLATLCCMFGGVAYTFILAKYLSPVSFGCYVLLMNSINIAFQVLDLRLVEIAIRLISSNIEAREPEKVFCVVKAVFYLGCLSALAAGFLSGVIGHFTLRQKFDGYDVYYAWCLGWLAVAVNSTIGAAAQSYFRAIYDFKTIAQNVVFSQLLKIIFVFLSIYLKGDSFAWILAMFFIAAFSSNLLLGILVIRKLKNSSFFYSNFMLPWEEIWVFIKNGRANYFNSLLSLPTKELDVTLVGFFSTVRDVAEYKLAKTIVSGLLSVYDPFQNVAYSHIVKHTVKKNWIELRKAVLIISLAMLFISFVLISIVFIYSVTLDQLMLGKGYSSGWFYIKIMIIPMPVVGVFLCGNLLVLALNRSGKLVKVNIILQAFVLFIYIAFTWKYQAHGTAFAYAIALGIAAIAPLFVLSDLVSSESRKQIIETKT
jgi:O-antigen/teichoic acid export membrane protein